MPDTTTGRGRPRPSRRPPRVALALTAGALFALFAGLSGPPYAILPATVAPAAAAVPAAPGCPKVKAPKTPRPEQPTPAPAGVGLVALEPPPPAGRCRRPPLPPDVIVPEPAGSPRTPENAAPKPGSHRRANRPQRPTRAAQQAAAQRPTARHRRAAPARPPATTTPPVAGYGRLSAPHYREPATPDLSYHRSLIYSGLFGLVLAVIGLAMVTRRRQRW